MLRWPRRGERHAFEAAVLEVLDPVLDLAVATVAQFQLDGITGLVGEHDLVTHPVVVPQPQLGARMGTFAAHDRPGVGRASHRR